MNIILALIAIFLVFGSTCILMIRYGLLPLPHKYHDSSVSNGNNVLKSLKDISWQDASSYDISDELHQIGWQDAYEITEELRQIRCRLFKVEKREPILFSLTDSDLELLAKLEHERWKTKMLQEGWRVDAEKDHVERTSPYLVPWEKLPDSEKEKNRDMVRGIPKILAKNNLEIRRVNTGA